MFSEIETARLLNQLFYKHDTTKQREEKEIEIQTWFNLPFFFYFIYFNLLFQFTISPLHLPSHLPIEQTMAAISAKSSKAPSS